METKIVKVLSLGLSANGKEILEHTVVLPGISTCFTTYDGTRLSVGTSVEVELDRGGRIKKWERV